MKDSHPEVVNPYADMLDMPHHVSTHYAQMSLKMRAAQFTPFAALAGYEEAIQDILQRHQSAQEESVKPQHESVTIPIIAILQAICEISCRMAFPC